jgi:pimeloyl-ACP methyl ester carboxylesterase
VNIRHHTAEVNGIRMHYVEAGQGPPLLLLHGFPETWYAWRHQIPVLAEHYHVIAPDLRGYGHTLSGLQREHHSQAIARFVIQHLVSLREFLRGHPVCRQLPVFDQALQSLRTAVR